MPNWDEEKGAFVPVTEAEITLSLDHRMLDGGSAGRLLARVGRVVERSSDGRPSPEFLPSWVKTPLIMCGTSLRPVLGFRRD